MISTNIKKGIAGVALASALAGGGSVAVDRSVVTDKEVHDSINTAITQGKIPEIDLSKVSLDRVGKAYVQIAQEYNVDLSVTAKPTDLYEKIRDKKVNRGEKVELKTGLPLKVE